ncbi:hypothetical protein [Luteibacter yeojuensis]|uniref:Uncharacterized protein n=1 Tax=Luteibacter yeojuensis TaxID=345309 RepID=A0A7X5QS54_9GAMM|nr:hypothetical protein [Luteibacter yeojuensis]NID14364.1 hypothetical protein [Luteibacter yeojuensis]
MRNVVEGASVGYAVTYLSGILAGFPWDKLASGLTAVWFAILIVDKAYQKAKAWLATRKQAPA